MISNNYSDDTRDNYSKLKEGKPVHNNFFHRNNENQPRQFYQHNYCRTNKLNKETIHKGKHELYNSSELLEPDPSALYHTNQALNSFLNKKNEFFYKKKKFNKKFDTIKTQAYYPTSKPTVINFNITKSSIFECAVVESKVLSEKDSSVTMDFNLNSYKQISMIGNNYNSYVTTENLKKKHILESKHPNLDDSILKKKGTSHNMIFFCVDESGVRNEEDDKPPPLSNIGKMSIMTQKNSYSTRNRNVNYHDVLLSNLTAKDLDYDRYARYSQHECEVKDYVRTITYKNAIEQNVEKLQNSVVMVLRTGLGLLAMMCVKHGRARKVIALESSSCAEYAEQIIKDNGLNHVITVLRKKPSEINDLKDFGVQYVDAIVSDWMGDCVLGHGDQLEDLIIARDTFLKPKGLLIPENVQLYAQAHDSRKHFQYNFSVWHNVYGFNMDAVTRANLFNGKRSKKKGKKKTKNNKQPIIDFFDPYKVVSNACMLYEWDLHKCSLKDACGIHNLPLQLVFARKDYCHLLELFFVVDFPSTLSNEIASLPSTTIRKTYDPTTSIGFSTSSFSPKTRYRQCGLLLDQELIVEKGDTFKGFICIWREQRNKNISKKNSDKMCNCCKNNPSTNLENSLIHLRNEYLNISLKYSFKNKHMANSDVVCQYELLRQIF
ncbi:uncharacterized protein LOC126898708 [Daktulosphaira vitifoliae]|uniref:uncharacterized protein LOC126898708 n=1 Tax=Daktulosphaira vitifoliae TaxID=58002 RepID=UPI0021AA7194|nr:uncharacterized protein LOC126898708 [Daktulosphaira vitifoliae]